MSRGSARAELHHSEAHHPLRFDCEHGCVARQLNPRRRRHDPRQREDRDGKSAERGKDECAGDRGREAADTKDRPGDEGGRTPR